LNCIVAFSGAHYLVFIRERELTHKERIWKLYNDDQEVQRFLGGFSEMAYFLVTSNAVPTMVFYESQEYQLSENVN